MNLKIYLINCILGITYSLKPLTSKIDFVFSKHGPNEIKPMFSALNEYTNEMIEETDIHSEKSMYRDMAVNLRNGMYYVDKKENETTVYLGWTPLTDDSTMLRNGRPLRNDNENISFRNVPLYFVFIEPKNKCLRITKIIHNPTIDIKIDIKLLKTHLEILANESKTSLDITPLKEFDSGRWYFELCNSFNLTQY